MLETFTCYGDTNLDALHDQILAPAMGWRRHYHAYKFLVPSNGACFAPKNSDAIDMMHEHTQGNYSLSSQEYDLRHVLLKKDSVSPIFMTWAIPGSTH